MSRNENLTWYPINTEELPTKAAAKLFAKMEEDRKQFAASRKAFEDEIEPACRLAVNDDGDQCVEDDQEVLFSHRWDKVSFAGADRGKRGKASSRGIKL